ncbi:MAG: hypothetical protein EXQ70_00835 [Solirubrobacterales bacterium]|nr:hypothetical protein [Solirubrobacterales bacterium]
MSRRRLALTAVVAAAVALGGLSASAAGGSGAPAVRAAADCTWKHHKKTVTVRKRVGKKGHRQFRKVKRTKRWWSCDPVSTPPSTTLGVRANEWHLILSRGSVDAGELKVQLRNEGEDPHNLHLELAGSPSYSFEDLDPGQIADRTLPLTPGTWKLYCSLAGHEDAGMRASLVVN